MSHSGGCEEPAESDVREAKEVGVKRLQFNVNSEHIAHCDVKRTRMCQMGEKVKKWVSKGYNSSSHAQSRVALWSNP